MKCGEPLASDAKPKRFQDCTAEGDFEPRALVVQSTPALDAWDIRGRRRVRLITTLLLERLMTFIELVLLFTSFLTIPLARQRFFHAALFTGLQVEGVTFHFFDDVFLLDLTLKPAQRIFKRFAFLHANLCQCTTPPNRPNIGLYRVQESAPNR